MIPGWERFRGKMMSSFLYVLWDVYGGMCRRLRVDLVLGGEATSRDGDRGVMGRE